MMKYCILCMLFSNLVFAQPIELTKNNWNKVKSSNLNSQWLTVLWSLECPPCFKELSLISKMVSKEPNLKVTLINTDASDDLLEQIQDVLAQYQLNKLTNFYFADEQAAQSRFMIDPTWYGELPRSYFFSSGGTAVGRSGLINKNTLNKWLK
ncbi:redoxin domain-containing protein [Pseudoalteromonas denitrificans]|uniref:AhpC/TSA family protein n=1 Tax=Pseudoalteromonas denitrificans DSM 6059 TaxID=1123010 RepID=A0A1I1PS45_9GAMM|nr:redoxin domain-containing protein [Pseudoalteromonas denitrificans]SFD12507.1 AhpC/TSA family protein [Pseudoalteromonas denitrificans DSM 6059]